ncbi:hypothetical protein FBU30_003184 [Linnemannia zychae]|nr:hypothetical protein FBU30_003184 [Linnemannia zychae]
MSNKQPSAKAIAKLNASILFPAIRSEIVANPSLFAIRGFFIFNITKKSVPMTEWYLLFQGFDAPAIVSQKKPALPKAKRDEDPIPVAILQIEDSDLLNFMSGGLTGSRGIVSGRIKIAGAIELAEQLEQIFVKAKGQEKTLAYLEQKRGKSEKARARLSDQTTFSTSPPTSFIQSEHKPIPTQSKVHDLARRFSAISKQALAENSYAIGSSLDLPQGRPRGASVGRTEGSKISDLMSKFTEQPKPTNASLPTAGSSVQRQDRCMASKDVEKEIESNLYVAEQPSDQVQQQDLDAVDFLSIDNHNLENNETNKLTNATAEGQDQKSVGVANVHVNEAETLERDQDECVDI